MAGSFPAAARNVSTTPCSSKAQLVPCGASFPSPEQRGIVFTDKVAVVRNKRTREIVGSICLTDGCGKRIYEKFTFSSIMGLFSFWP